MQMQTFSYDNKIVKYFLYATLFWAVMAFFFGVLVATLLFFPTLPEYIFGSDDGTIGGNIQGLVNSQGKLGFGRLRMIHTTFAVFAFVGNTFFTGAYYSMQRLLKTRMYSDVMSWIVFWGWQLFIVLSFVTFIYGYNTSKEYAEHEWPIDILIALVWIVFGLQMFITIAKRRVRHLYVAIWFYIGTWAAITMLHVFNNLEIPVTFSLTAPKSYSLYSGVQDALVQWWYGHNAVGFFLTAGFLGMMYYYVPKQANRPIYSYRLSVVHFWALIFTYMWAGPHHLHYTALPDWTQGLGMAFSIILLAPSWGGMINGVMTMSGAWDKLRTDPILKFLIVSLSFYGMSTFEGPMMAIKSVNALSHYTDWTVGHVHSGALGWVGFISIGSLYYLIPRVFNRETMYSTRLIELHFWVATIGVVLYITSMWVSGVTEGVMWRDIHPDGTLKYAFVEVVEAVRPLRMLRVLGGLMYLSGMILMGYNVWRTAKAGEPVDARIPEVTHVPH